MSTICKTMDIVQNESGSTFMRDKFHHEVFNPQDTIDQYIGRILSYQDRLANTSQKLSNEDFITKLLTGLPATYQIVKKIIFNQPDRTITSIIAALRRHAEIRVHNQVLHNQVLQLHQAEILVQPEMLAELQFPEVYFQGEVDVVGSRDLDSKMVVSKDRIRHLLVLFKEGSPTVKLLSETKSHEVSQNWPSRNSCTSQYGRTPTAPQESSCCRCYANDSSGQYLDH